MRSSASMVRAAVAGSARAFLHAAFITSNGSNSGECRWCPAISERIRSPSGSPNTTAHIADASTTLSGIAHLADDVDRSRTAWQLEPLRPLVHLPKRQRRNVFSRLLDDREQFALQRPAIAGRPFPKSRHDRTRNV